VGSPSSYSESTDFATVGRKRIYPTKPALIRLKWWPVNGSDSKSSSKSSKAQKPNFREPTAAKTSQNGAFLPNLATLVICPHCL